MNLFYSMQVEILKRKKYVFIIVDEYSRFTWIHLLHDKAETFDEFKKLIIRLMNEKSDEDVSIDQLRGNHGREFENQQFLIIMLNLGLSFNSLLLKQKAKIEWCC
ncbi:hypothetical protein Syun_006625 [Stephania yunnanensis]|uniref:Integrase catalytic domain-containing protein n=1 Tax=Stephania yunnanensis TaxID=152371 RepID=A0AAP0PZH5_9MAGN